MSEIGNLIESLSGEPWMTLMALADAAETEPDSLIAHLAPGLRELAEGRKFPCQMEENYFWQNSRYESIDGFHPAHSRLPINVWEDVVVSEVISNHNPHSTARIGRRFKTTGEAFIAAATAWSEVIRKQEAES